MRGRPDTRPVPPSPASPAATPARLCGTPRGPQYLGQRVGPRDLCFDCDFPFGGDGVGHVEGGGASPSVHRPPCEASVHGGGRGVDLPPPGGCLRPGRRAAEVTGLPGPGPRQAVWIKIREVSFGP